MEKKRYIIFETHDWYEVYKLDEQGIYKQFVGDHSYKYVLQSIMEDLGILDAYVDTKSFEALSKEERAKLDEHDDAAYFQWIEQELKKLNEEEDK